MVAQAFIPKLSHTDEVNHIDSNTSNNAVENLEWVTHHQNMQHAFSKGNGKHPPLHHGEAQHNSKLTEKVVREIRERYSSGKVACAAIARDYNVSRNCIHSIVQRKSWKHIT